MNQQEAALRQAKIKYILISGKHCIHSERFLTCEYAILKTEDRFFRLEAKIVGEEQYDVAIEETEEAPEDAEARKILATAEEPIRYLGRETRFEILPMLEFAIGKRTLMMSAGNTGVMVGLTRPDLEDGPTEYGSEKLLNDGK